MYLLSLVHTSDISISISTRSIRKQSMIYPLGLVNTKQQELCLCLCRSICRRMRHCIPLFCPFFFLMLMLMPLFFCLMSSRLELIKNLFNFHNRISRLKSRFNCVPERIHPTWIAFVSWLASSKMYPPLQKGNAGILFPSHPIKDKEDKL